ncbi:sugar kinase [Pelagovum pacificum]|uniref:Sugar kinase n=1 Tax=Pelagovum pacificum TaxID=2588711 RepID=A0A5C5GK39_9RHOB|nr:sugar kinase [Pelagovum pacificum]QQA42710.1 sugar kinase [Pelagovum pacificum]TNY34139.1 sugar kinase [Pelagovum pacificum]
MTSGRFVSIGEAMLELSEGASDGWALNVAGDTLNTAWYLRKRLGPEWEVDYVTRVGTDAFSDRIVSFLGQSGLGAGHVARDPDRGPGLYAISLTEGERSFTYWRSQSAARHLADDEEALDAAMSGATMLYLSAITLAILAPERREALLDRAAASGVPLAYDPNFRPRLWESPDAARDWTTLAARQSQIVLPSADDEAACFGDASPEATADRYEALGTAEVVVKTGGGPVLVRGTERAEVTDLPRVTPVDTTGAGDSFNAGYLAARLMGQSPIEAVRAGHDVASRVVQGRGALVPLDSPP